MKSLGITVKRERFGRRGVASTTDSRAEMEVYYDQDGNEVLTTAESLGTYNLEFRHDEQRDGDAID